MRNEKGGGSTQKGSWEVTKDSHQEQHLPPTLKMAHVDICL